MRKLPCADAIAVGLLAFPSLLAAFGVLGLVFGVPIQRVYAPVAFALSLLIAYGLPREYGLRCVIWTGALIVGSVIVSLLPVMFCVSDAMNCYRVGLAMLADGWNPLQEPEVSQIAAWGGGFNPWHVAYGFKLQWIAGAALCRATGSSMSGDACNLFFLISCLILVHGWLRLRCQFSRPVAVFLVLCVCLSPNVIGFTFGGKNDPILYHCMCMVLVSFDQYRSSNRRFHLALLVLCAPWMLGIKATGLVNFVIFSAVYLGLMVVDGFCRRCSWKKPLLAAIAVLVGVVLAILMNASPLITSYAHHGTPFYPMRTVDGHEVPQKITQLTNDCDIMNDDARSMGAVQRYVRAYVSESLVDWVRSCCDGKKFSPEWPELFSKPTGYGPIFRFFFVLSLLLLLLGRVRVVRAMWAAVFISTLAVPVKFVGMGHYVQQIYLLPVLAAIGVAVGMQGFCVRRAAIVIVCGGYSLLMGLPRLNIYPYMWLSSVQNLQILEAVRNDVDAVIASRNYYGQYLWRHDSADVLDVRFSGPNGTNGFVYCYGSVARRYDYWSKISIGDDYYDVSFNDAGRDLARRRTGVPNYFMNTFLPKELCRIGKRFRQWSRFRLSQFVSAWCDENEIK